MKDPIDEEIRRIAMAQYEARCQKELDDTFGQGAIILLAIGIGALVFALAMGWV